ncbi:hypothetical protein STREPTOSP366_53640 [Streptomyces variabilis]
MSTAPQNEKAAATRDLTGKRALVTGGTRGIGAAVVRRLLDAGADVLTTARSPSGTVPEGARFTEADVRTRESAEALAEAVRDGLGGVDIVVHNAGGAAPRPGALAIPDAEWQHALDLNFLSAVRLDALLAPGMRERRAGAIVHVSSAVVPVPGPLFLHYTAAKAALENYSRGLAAEPAPDGVRVNTVTPGRTATPGGEETQAVGRPERHHRRHRDPAARPRGPAGRHRPRGAVPRLRPGELGHRHESRRGRRGIPAVNTPVGSRSVASGTNTRPVASGMPGNGHGFRRAS